MQKASLQQVMQCMTDLAEFVVDQALTYSFSELDNLYGIPTNTEGKRTEFWVIGMGKTGARELNVSSDIDLIFIYQEDGYTQTQSGQTRISNHEYFSKAVRMVCAQIGDVTEHGFVFRVDLALRPNGNSGPPTISLTALQKYFHTQGREWERFAWLKSRVIAPEVSTHLSANTLRPVVLPFVFRRYLDYGVFESLRKLHKQIRDQSNKKGIGKVQTYHDIKTGRGGIREIEFIVQLLQVVRGGQFPEIRNRATLGALHRLARARLMPSETSVKLVDAYNFLRRLEHRIQYLDDQQTHTLPTRPEDLSWIAKTMGYVDNDTFLHDLKKHGEIVATAFEQLLLGADTEKSMPSLVVDTTKTAPPENWETIYNQPTWPPILCDYLVRWGQNKQIESLPETTKDRLLRLIYTTGHWVSEGKVTILSAERWLDWIGTFLPNGHYLALLLERPKIHERILQLLGTAKWASRFLKLHPGTVDELANDRVLQERFDSSRLIQSLEARLHSLRMTQEDDEETLLNVLRRAYHGALLRTLARDISGKLTVEQVADDLSALADTILKITYHWCWEKYPKKHRESPLFAILGYGKLGGKELGYGSDLDLVFIYDDPDENAQAIYTGFIRRLIHWLTAKTSEGDLFEVDTALRPNGHSGMLVNSFTAYANYQKQNGSNTAWTWEHQAITRARFITGMPSLAGRFDLIRTSVITAQRHTQDLRAAIIDMRQRLRQAHPVSSKHFDFKHSPGGMVDCEFVVQYLVLGQASRYPGLQGNWGNIALLKNAEQVGLLPTGMGEAAGKAYRTLRYLQHQARLNELPSQADIGQLQTEKQAIVDLWQEVLG
jgi:glutamate-ammonia-ligase adenylyltransferase